MKPCYDIPKDKLLDLEKLKAKSKPLKSVLKIPTKVNVVRKDLAVNWDEVFWLLPFLLWFNKTHNYINIEVYLLTFPGGLLTL